MNREEAIDQLVELEYRSFARQALRFIAEIGGPQALDRFVSLVHPVFESTRPDAMTEVARLRALPKIDEDIESAKSVPDLI